MSYAEVGGVRIAYEDMGPLRRCGPNTIGSMEHYEPVMSLATACVFTRSSPGTHGRASSI
jgi:hypothetical protein